MSFNSFLWEGLNGNSALRVLGASVPWIHIYCGSLCRVPFIGWVNGEQNNALSDDNNFPLDFNEWWCHYPPLQRSLKVRSTDPECLWKVQSCHSDHEITSYSRAHSHRTGSFPGQWVIIKAWLPYWTSQCATVKHASGSVVIVTSQRLSFTSQAMSWNCHVKCLFSLSHVIFKKYFIGEFAEKRLAWDFYHEPDEICCRWMGWGTTN